ncbi:Hypothetical predicted protein [Mytilus galloprovincialis]|uniref:Reverse transcriptase domain-containing protein n=1 Tax=Mytilus galloprovincialis TaxID=29158 RepID=A0A8B6H2F4_MYTGA|nr:Hypothetical predicted protein [Mytilus galloprovincialis]
MQFIKQDFYCFKFDILSAYHHLDIYEPHTDYLGFSWTYGESTKYFKFLVLPFGLSSACYIFTKVTRPLIKKWRGEGKQILMYLDDGFGTHSDINSCTDIAAQVKQDLIDSGFVPKVEKSMWSPSKTLIYLGYFIDTDKAILSIPVDRLSKLFDTIIQVEQSLRNLGKVYVRTVASVIGQIISMSYVIGNVAYIMTKYLSIDVMSACSWKSYIELSVQSKEQLIFWKKNIKCINFKHFVSDFSCHTIVYSDASGTGYGGFTVENPKNIAHGMWHENDVHHSSTWKELTAVKCVFHSLIDFMRDKRIKWFTDNQNVVSIVHKGSMKPYLQDIAYDIFVTCLKFNVSLEVEWIPRAENEIADYISRIIDTDDWGVAVHVFEYLDSLWGPHEIDWFASDHNHRLPVFYSRNDITELPNDLDSYLAIIPDLLAQSKSDNTVKKYYYGFLRWKKWAEINHISDVDILPTKPLYLALYLASLVQFSATSSPALTSLNNGQRPHEVSDILSLDLDGELAKRANAELNHLKKEYLECEKEKEQIESDFSFYREGHLPKNIAEANAAIVDAWRIEDESFYETKGTEFVYDKVKESDCMLVTSNSGLGKTATIRHIALKLHSEGFEIVPVESPEDIIKYKTNQKQVFLIDDVLGKYDLSLTLLEKWERINEKLICYLRTEMGSNKILCTLRLQVERHKRFKNASTILNQVVINLEHESTALSKEEKRKMLLKHLNRSNTENEIKAEEIEIMCDSKYAFPLLCKLVSNNEERFRKRIAFFRQPLSLLKEELIKISIENKKLYCTLVLCMLYNGTLSRSMFDIDSHECDEKIYTIIQTCGLKRNMSKKELEESALSAMGSYFTKDSYNIRFIHDALAETVGCHFCTFNPKVMFSECHILFIRDRVRVGLRSDENENDNEDENIVIIQEDELNENHFRPLFNRLFNELKSGRFSSLLMSHLFKNRNFVRIFGITIDNNRSIFVSIHTLLTKVSSERVQRDQSIFEKTVEFLSSYRDQSVVGKKVEEICSSNKEFQDNNDAISRVIEAIWSRSTLMYWIIAFGCYEFFKYTWSKITTIERKWFLGSDIIQQPPFKSFFPLAVLGGSIDIVTQLISSGADVNCFSEFWETPLYIAVKSGRYDMVSLLVSKGAKVNLRGWFAMKIPVSVTANNHELTSLMLESDLNQTELHIAVRQNDLTKLRSSNRSENIDSKTKSGWTVLHYAVILNNIAAVKALLHEVLHQNDDHCFDSTQDDQGDLICRKPTPKVNIVDNNGLTALHLAVINNNIEIVALLLRKKAKVKIPDHFDRTPLHYTKSDRATKLLLIHSSGTNQSAEEENGYNKPALSALRTVLSNITLQTALRVVCRDCVNMPDKEGDTPLHSVIKRRLVIEECSDCIETLLQNGADPYLCNESGFSAYELIDSSSETAKYINYSATYKQSLEKTHAVFALVLFTFIVLTIGLPVWLSVMISKKSQNAVNCVGQVAESENIQEDFQKTSTVFKWSGNMQ